jgi:hypothetical protein
MAWGKNSLIRRKRAGSWQCLLLGAVLCVFPVSVSAQTLVEIETPLGAAYCQKKADAWIAGTQSNGKFRSLSAQISGLRRQLANAPKKKQKTLRTRLAALKALYRAAKKGCEELLLTEPEPSPSPSPTPLPPSPSPSAAPSTSPSASPSASATPRPSCYDAQRNTSCFGIPSPLVGNESSGAALFSGCQGCHTGSGDGGKRNKSYSQIQNALLEVPQMQPFSDSYSAQDIAHLTAYLNRFNPNQ